MELLSHNKSLYKYLRAHFDYQVILVNSSIFSFTDKLVRLRFICEISDKDYIYFIKLDTSKRYGYSIWTE